MKKGKGFTLVELLAVIVLLAIIIGISVPAVSKIHTSVNEKQYRNKLELIKTAALKYADDTNYTSFYVDDLVMNGYLEADKIVKNDNGDKLYLEIDNRDNKTIMNCYVVIIQDKNGVLEAKIDEKVDEGNKDYAGNAGCAVNLPNSVNEYFDVQIKEFVNGTPVPLTYNKYNGWWTKNKVELTITGKNGNKIDEIEWYEGSSLTPIDSSNPNYTLRTTNTDSTITNPPKNIIEIGETVDGVLQQNYTARIKMGDRNYSVTTRVYIDKISPDYYSNNGTAASVSTEWTKSVNYTISAYDNESGLYSYFMDKADEIGTCPDKKEDYTAIKKRKRITENGSYYACIIDNVGNVKQSELLEFNNIDNSNLACNITLDGNKGNNNWYIGGADKKAVTLTVKPRTDNGYSIGPSGLEIGINNAPKSWPEKNTANSDYRKIDPYTTDSGVSYATWLSQAIALTATTVHSTDTSGTYYYGHIANQAGENKSCAKNIKYEKEIGKPTLTGSTPDYEKITLKFTTGSSQSGLYKAYCSSATETDVEATCDGTTCNCVMKVAATSTETEYTFSIKNVSKAGNESTLTDVKAKNKSACDETVQGDCTGCGNWTGYTDAGRCGETTDTLSRSCTSCTYTSKNVPGITCPSDSGKQSTTYTGGKKWKTYQPDPNTCSDWCGGTRTGSVKCVSTADESITCTKYTGTCTKATEPDAPSETCGGKAAANAADIVWANEYYTNETANKCSGTKLTSQPACKTDCGTNKYFINRKGTQKYRSNVAGHTDYICPDSYNTPVCSSVKTCDAQSPCYCGGEINNTYWASNQEGSATSHTYATCSKKAKPSSISAELTFAQTDPNSYCGPSCNVYIKQDNYLSFGVLYYKEGNEYKACSIGGTGGTLNDCNYYARLNSTDYKALSTLKTPGDKDSSGNKYGNIIITVECSTSLQTGLGGYTIKGGLIVE